MHSGVQWQGKLIVAGGTLVADTSIPDFVVHSLDLRSC
jgi:hypothetical protein